MPLPEFVPPMLARQGEPFDSADHLFEIKWDGTRAQLRLPGDGGYTLTNRRRRDLTVRYPELAFLGQLGESGYLLDGEIIVIQDGKPDFASMLTREQAQNTRKIESLSQSLPATLVVFDLLYAKGASIMPRPLAERRQALEQFVAAHDHPRLVLSEGIVGGGLSYFAAATERDLEGVMAKRLASPYQPGRRTDDWLKIKQKHTLHCAIVGFVAVDNDVRSLIIAAQVDGELRCVGKVGSGLTVAMRHRLGELFAKRLRDTPWIACEERGQWVEPGLYCVVSYLERTASGLRAPVFLDLITDP